MSTLTETTFKRIAEIARRRWGLSLGERKMQLVANRLSSHLRKNGGGEIEDFVQHGADAVVGKPVKLPVLKDAMARWAGKGKQTQAVTPALCEC